MYRLYDIFIYKPQNKIQALGGDTGYPARLPLDFSDKFLGKCCIRGASEEIPCTGTKYQ